MKAKHRRSVEKKPYDKPQVTRVRLVTEENVLQGCRGEFPNKTGEDPVFCYSLSLCEKSPTL